MLAGVAEDPPLASAPFRNTISPKKFCASSSSLLLPARVRCYLLLARWSVLLVGSLLLSKSFIHNSIIIYKTFRGCTTLSVTGIRIHPSQGFFLMRSTKGFRCTFYVPSSPSRRIVPCRKVHPLVPIGSFPTRRYSPVHAVDLVSLPPNLTWGPPPVVHVQPGGPVCCFSPDI